MVSILLKIFRIWANVIIWDIDKKELDSASKEIDNNKLSSNVVDVSNYNNVKKPQMRLPNQKNWHFNYAGITSQLLSFGDYDVKEWIKL